MTPPILVCGLGRCGTSLLMQMLHCGGLPAYGDWPAFEPDDTGANRNLSTLLPRLDGRAVKILDPHRSEWPRIVNAKTIWLDRDVKEQAKSQVKFLWAVAGFTVPCNHWRSMVPQLKKDRRACFDLFALLSLRPYLVNFEDVLSDPKSVAGYISEFLNRQLDITGMASAVIPRSGKCQPDLSIEVRLCGGGAPRA